MGKKETKVVKPSKKSALVVKEKEVLASKKSKKVEKKPVVESSSESDSSSSDSSSSESEAEVPEPVKKSSKKESKKAAKKESKSAKKESKKTVKKEESSSSESESDASSSSSSSESESEVEAAPVKAVKKSDSSSDSSSGSESEDEAKPEVAKADASDSDSSSGSESETEAKVKVETKDDASSSSGSDSSSDSDSGSESDSESSEDEMEVDNKENVNKRKAEETETESPKKAKAEVSDEATSTVHVRNLSWNMDDNALYNECSQIGVEPNNVRVVTDRETGRSRGFAFITFESPEDAQKAINELNEKEMDGRAVTLTFASDSRPPKKEFNDRNGGSPRNSGVQGNAPADTLFVGNMSFHSSEETLREAFAAHADVQSVRIPTDRETGRVKGFAYVQFYSTEDAQKAKQGMEGQDVDGRVLRLDFASARPQGGQQGFGGRGRGTGRGASRGGRGAPRGRG